MLESIVKYVKISPVFIYIFQVYLWMYTWVAFVSNLLTFRRGKIHRYPRDLKLKFVGFYHTEWVEDDCNCICNLPTHFNQKQYIMDIHAGERLPVTTAPDGLLSWEKFFEDLSKYTFHDDID